MFLFQGQQGTTHKFEAGEGDCLSKRSFWLNYDEGFEGTQLPLPASQRVDLIGSAGIRCPALVQSYSRKWGSCVRNLIVEGPPEESFQQR